MMPRFLPVISPRSWSNRQCLVGILNLIPHPLPPDNPCRSEESKTCACCRNTSFSGALKISAGSLSRTDRTDSKRPRFPTLFLKFAHTDATQIVLMNVGSRSTQQNITSISSSPSCQDIATPAKSKCSVSHKSECP